MIDTHTTLGIANRYARLEDLLINAIATAAARLETPGIEYWKPDTSIQIEIYKHFEVVQLQPFKSKLIPKAGVKFLKLQQYEFHEFQHEWFLVVSNEEIFGMLYSHTELFESDEDGAKIEIVEISRMPEFLIGNCVWFTGENKAFLLSD